MQILALSESEFETEPGSEPEPVAHGAWRMTYFLRSVER